MSEKRLENGHQKVINLNVSYKQTTWNSPQGRHAFAMDFLKIWACFCKRQWTLVASDVGGFWPNFTSVLKF